MSDSTASTTRDPRALADASDLSADVDFQQVELQGDFSEAAMLRARWIVPVRQPLILISEVQRSGGHLLARLFDGHPACINHPHELKWGRPTKGDWPSFDVNAGLKPETLFDILREGWQDEAAAKGGLRVSPGSAATYPFRLEPMLHDALFMALLETGPCASRRDVLDAYLTASFNAWLDYRGLYAAPKRYVTAFIPCVTMMPGSLDRFFADYPDGHLITIVRHPGSWLASALRSPTMLRQHGGDADAAMRIWSASTEASLQAAAGFRPRVTIAFFDELVHRTQDVMTHFCHTLGLDFHPCLTTPTFNGMPVRSNSLYRPVEGIDVSATDRYRNILLPEQTAALNAALPLYEDVFSRHGLGGDNRRLVSSVT